MIYVRIDWRIGGYACPKGKYGIIGTNWMLNVERRYKQKHNMPALGVSKLRQWREVFSRKEKYVSQLLEFFLPRVSRRMEIKVTQKLL